MASVSHDKKTGRRTIEFVGLDGRTRPKIRLGKVTKKQAESAKLFIEDLIACKGTGGPLKAATVEWITDLPDIIRRRVERTGLIAPRERRVLPTLAEWLESYIRGRRDVRPNTAANYERTRSSLIEFFGKAKRLDEITAGDADDFRIDLKSKGLAEATIRGRCKRAKQFFAAAVKKKIIAENPFVDIKCGNYANAERYYFLSRQETQAVLDACPDAEWRLIFALCRFGGLRCPSEVLRLQWGDIDWEHSRFTVHAIKTEHHPGGGVRQVPIFPELHPYLRDCFEQAEPGQVHVITRYRDVSANLRTQLSRIIKQAGLKPWPKLFQNLRSTRETELAEELPLHVVCEWIGNSQPTAAKHYLQVTEEHFAKAAQNPAQHPAKSGGKSSQREAEGEAEPATCGAMRKETAPCHDREPFTIPPRGVEPLSPG